METKRFLNVLLFYNNGKNECIVCIDHIILLTHYPIVVFKRHRALPINNNRMYLDHQL